MIVKLGKKAWIGLAAMSLLALLIFTRVRRDDIYDGRIQQDFRNIDHGLRCYYLDHNLYPESLADLYDANGELYYLEHAPVDSWGTPYIYDAPLGLWSCGPNRVDESGEGDDIRPSW